MLLYLFIKRIRATFLFPQTGVFFFSRWGINIDGCSISAVKYRENTARKKNGISKNNGSIGRNAKAHTNSRQARIRQETRREHFRTVLYRRQRRVVLFKYIGTKRKEKGVFISEIMMQKRHYLF